MANYLLVFHGGGSPASESERKLSMKAWGDWIKQCGDNMVDQGKPCGDAMTVTKLGSTAYVGNERATGYSIIKASNMEDAVQASSMAPIVVDGSGSVTVYELLEIM